MSASSSLTCGASTAMAEGATASDFASVLNRFYATASDVLIRHDGLVDKLIGDEVMGLFVSGLAGTDYRRKAALAALDLATSVPDVPHSRALDRLCRR